MTVKQGALWIDLGLRYGWTVLSEQDRITFGEHALGSFSDLQLGARFPVFRAHLEPIFRLWKGRGIIGYETPQKFKSRDTTLSMFGMESVLHELVAVHGWRFVYRICPSSLKKVSTGAGKAEKPQMIKAAAKRWGLLEKGLGDNEADALNGMSWMMGEMGRREAGPARRVGGMPWPGDPDA